MATQRCGPAPDDRAVLNRLYLDQQLHERLQAPAEENERILNGQIGFVLRRWLEQAETIDGLTPALATPSLGPAPPEPRPEGDQPPHWGTHQPTGTCDMRLDHLHLLTEFPEIVLGNGEREPVSNSWGTDPSQPSSWSTRVPPGTSR